MKYPFLFVIVLALAPLGKAVGVPFPRTRPAPHLEIVNLVPGLVRSEDVAAWLVETTNEPTRDGRRIPLSRSAPAPSLRTNIESWPSVANRNSNPLNIKLGSETRRYVDVGLATVSDIIPQDGGRFLKFDSPETGFRAAAELLSTPRYDGLELDRALRTWSNNGFGAEILLGTQLDAQSTVPLRDRDDLTILLNRMAAAEGYKSFTRADEVKRAIKAMRTGFLFP